MAGILLQSRFAGLKIDDEDVRPTREVKQKKKVTNKEAPKKPKANITTKPQNSNGQKKKKNKTPSPKAQQKEGKEEYFDGEEQLQQVLLLSKLDYEKNDAEKKNIDTNSRPKKSQNKKKVMCLEEFNVMYDENNKLNGAVDELIKERRFNTDEESTQPHAKIKIQEKCKEVCRRPQLSNEAIHRQQFEDALERKDKEISTLTEELETARKELETVKSRNYLLCSILSQGEMKDKVEVIIEVERLRSANSELTDEVSSLLTQLEREKSRNADPRAKDKKKKVQ